MIVESYIKQYAEAKEKTILSNYLMGDENKQKGIKQIKGAVKARERGLITIDECVRCICDCMAD